jgi:O-antigen ligase
VRWFIGRGKIGWAFVYMAAAITIVSFAPESWTQRMATIINGAPAATEQARTRVRLVQENPGEGPGLDESAAVRLIMWQWTFNYALDNPFGGGFDLYKVSRAGNEKVLQRRAYHSSFFQVLGEHGWIGLFLFLAMNAVAMWYAFQAKRIAKRRPELAWIRDLSTALITGQMCLLAAGAFTDMAFHPPFYYIFSLAICVHEYVRRVQEPYAAAKPAATAALPLPGGVVAGVSAGMAQMQAQHTLNARQRP